MHERFQKEEREAGLIILNLKGKGVNHLFSPKVNYTDTKGNLTKNFIPSNVLYI